jgi:hypothetical protein
MVKRKGMQKAVLKVPKKVAMLDKMKAARLGFHLAEMLEHSMVD